MEREDGGSDYNYWKMVGEALIIRRWWEKL
jgi:hypothetical protein